MIFQHVYQDCDVDSICLSQPLLEVIIPFGLIYFSVKMLQKGSCKQTFETFNFQLVRKALLKVSI